MVHVCSSWGDVEVHCDAQVSDVLRQLEEGLGIRKRRCRLVHEGRTLTGGALAEAGVTEADSVVALLSREPAPTIVYAEGASAVDLSTINAAIAKERAERGEESHRAAEEGEGASDFPFLRRVMHQLAALGGVRPSPQGQVRLFPGQVQTLWDTIESCLRTAEQLGSAEAGPSTADAPVADAPTAPLPVADEGSLEHLVAMGFPEGRSRKALLLRGNVLESAMEWLLEHSEDPDVDTPLSDAQLHGLGGAGPVPSVVQPDPEALRQLVEMGFDEAQATEALRATFNDQEAACAYLLGERDIAPPRALLSLASLRNPRLLAEYRRAAEMAPEQRIRMFRAMLSGPAVSVDPPPVPGEPEASSRRLLELLTAFQDVHEDG